MKKNLGSLKISLKVQTKKNIELAGKVIWYLMNGKDLPELPDDVSFVPFSKDDTQLNKANQKLLEAISKDDKPVVIAEEPKTVKEPWKITPVNF